jgi:hemin uptake protein HemP
MVSSSAHDGGIQPDPRIVESKPGAAEFASPRRLTSEALFCEARELIIEHAGREYRLRITANGKLILTA